MNTKTKQALERISASANKGFTVFETLVVLSIATILSAAAIPNFVGYVGKERLAKAAQEVVSDISKSKMNAIRENRSYNISITGAQEYKISIDTNSNAAFEENEAVETRNLGVQYQDISLSSTANLTFSARGTASAATITLASGRWQKTITVNIAGRITISQ
jgi:prepilin-type N-terminal cleavage/methylation domain-containing protein